ncbi:uncharacterized protein RSE6_06794 [Rhynchosporium secalis]|uniref:Fe2OG dioxygenase domain-containing protein n=1 Tax=Rhynchosporium secalis TaxID=38038 RepID=A0A1E1MC93_RHYSE|nr:uncharacterized protein RSE6_06794 [Rhynchosporium secalis]
MRESFFFRYNPIYDLAVSENLEAIPAEIRENLVTDEFCWEDHIDSRITYHDAGVGLNYYPPIRPSEPGSESQNSIGSHTDFQLFVILWQYSNGGLQVLNREGEWIDAALIEGTFVVNFGDYLSRATNDQYIDEEQPKKYELTSSEDLKSLAMLPDDNVRAHPKPLLTSTSTYREATKSEHPNTAIATIDITKIDDHDQITRAALAQELNSASTSCGSFFPQGHGMSEELPQKVSTYQNASLLGFEERDGCACAEESPIQLLEGMNQ